VVSVLAVEVVALVELTEGGTGQKIVNDDP
jgi:hypothetical protein